MTPGFSLTGWYSAPIYYRIDLSLITDWDMSFTASPAFQYAGFVVEIILFNV